MYTFVCVLFEFTFKNFNVVIYESDGTIMYVWNSVLIVCIVIEFTLCAFHSEFCLWNGDRETCATKFFVSIAGDVWKCVAKEFNFCLIMLKLFSIFCWFRTLSARKSIIPLFLTWFLLIQICHSVRLYYQ